MNEHSIVLCGFFCNIILKLHKSNSFWSPIRVIQPPNFCNLAQGPEDVINRCIVHWVRKPSYQNGAEGETNPDVTYFPERGIGSRLGGASWYLSLALCLLFKQNSMALPVVFTFIVAAPIWTIGIVSIPTVVVIVSSWTLIVSILAAVSSVGIVVWHHHCVIFSLVPGTRNDWIQWVVSPLGRCSFVWVTLTRQIWRTIKFPCLCPNSLRHWFRLCHCHP